MGTIIKLFGNNDAHLPPQPKDGFMDANAFRADIVRPALRITGLWSLSAENLIVGTALVESGLEFVKQFSGGPAVSFLQVEPTTYSDITRYLNNRQSKIRDSILSACYLETFPEPSAMIWNLRLAVLIARAIYYRRPEPLPSSSDYVSLSKYYKVFYNTSAGKSTLDKSLPHFKKACGV